MVHALPGFVSHRHRLRRYDQGRPRRQGSRASGQRGRQVVAEADPPHRRHAHEGRDAGGREEHRSLAEKAGPGKGRRTEKGRREERVKDVVFFCSAVSGRNFFSRFRSKFGEFPLKTIGRFLSTESVSRNWRKSDLQKICQMHQRVKFGILNGLRVRATAAPAAQEGLNSFCLSLL